MNRLLPPLILPACLLALLSIATAANDSTCREYLGDLNKESVIRLSLCEVEGRALTGYYFYKRWLKDIQVRGEYTGQRDITLKEHDEKGQVKGSFSLRFADKDPRRHFGNSKLDKEVLTGKWTSADGSQSYPVYLYLTGESSLAQGQNRYAVAGASDDALVERHAQGFYFAVLKGDRQEAAKYVGYPLSYNDQGSRKVARNQAEFLRAYDRIFTERFVAKIAEGIPHHMFAKADGIMLGNGEVWFDSQGKAHALNN